MTVYFIGAGPGDPDLITVKGARLVARCPVCIHAGSLVPPAIIARAPQGARVLDSATMVLEEIIDEISKADAQGLDVARVHSGDPSLYGAIAEQIRALVAARIAYEIVPGVPAYAAAAAALGQELTLPEVAQTLILTRTAMKASPMPEGEALAQLGRSGATLAIHLSARNMRAIERDLTPLYGADCPAVLAWRVSWPDGFVRRTTLCGLQKLVHAHRITRTALVLVGPALDPARSAAARASALYDAHHCHILRPKAAGLRASPARDALKTGRQNAGHLKAGQQR